MPASLLTAILRTAGNTAGMTRRRADPGENYFHSTDNGATPGYVIMT
jgi:hypothetical protein